jgi:hypothetical protein
MPSLQCRNHTTRPSTYGWCSLYNRLSYSQRNSFRLPAHCELRGSLRRRDLRGSGPRSRPLLSVQRRGHLSGRSCRGYCRCVHPPTLDFGASVSELYLGIADWVRLRAGFEPPHWKPGGSRWDEGYQVTAYFLQWLTERYGEGTVPEINELMKSSPYDEHIFKAVTGRKVNKLWELYKEHLGK